MNKDKLLQYDNIALMLAEINKIHIVYHLMDGGFVDDMQFVNHAGTGKLHVHAEDAFVAAKKAREYFSGDQILSIEPIVSQDPSGHFVWACLPDNIIDL